MPAAGSRQINITAVIVVDFLNARVDHFFDKRQQTIVSIWKELQSHPHELVFEKVEHTSGDTLT
jgi:hypothetical protein